MPDIHPSSVIDPGAELAQDVCVGPLCHVGPHVTIGAGTRLVSHVAILGPTEIGAHNRVWPQAVLGGEPQDRKYTGENSRLVIGDHNDIREGVTIHRGTDNDEGLTRVGSHNLIMGCVHVAHDCIIGDHVVIANSVGMAGHARIENCAVIAGMVGMHHFVTIGCHAYVGGMTRLVQDVPPYMIVEGNPAKVRGINSIGLGRHGFDDQTIGRIKEAYKKIFRNSTQDQAVGKAHDGLAQLEKDYGDDPTISNLVAAVRNSTASVHGRYRESLRRDDRRKPLK